MTIYSLVITRSFAPGFANYKIGCTRLAAVSDKVYQLLAHGSHDIAEILLKVALNTISRSINPLVKTNIPNLSILHSKQSKHLLILHQNDDLNIRSKHQSK